MHVRDVGREVVQPVEDVGCIYQGPGSTKNSIRGIDPGKRRFSDAHRIVAPRLSESSFRNVRRSSRTRTSRSTVTCTGTEGLDVSTLHFASDSEEPYLVQKEDVPVPHQSHAQLHTPALAVRNLVHMPVEVDIEDVQQAVAPFLVPIPAHRVEEIRNDDVAAHDRIHRPGRDTGADM